MEKSSDLKNLVYLALDSYTYFFSVVYTLDFQFLIASVHSYA